MKKWITISAVVAASVAAALGASGTEAAAPERFTFQQQSAHAQFYGFLPPEVGGFGGYPVALDVSVESKRVGSDTGDQLEAYFFDTFRIYDPVTYDVLLACTGYTVLDDGQFTVADDAGTATLDATIDFFWGVGEGPDDSNICPTLPSAHVVLEWTPTSTVSVNRGHVNGDPCDSRYTSRSANTLAAGTTTAGAAGDIPIADGGGTIATTTAVLRCR